MDREIKRRFPLTRKYGFTALAATAIAAAGIWAFIRAGSSIHRADSNDIITGEAFRGSFNDYIRLTGTVETATSVQVTALESGMVRDICAEEGALVEEGDIILTMFNPNLQQQILDSESQLAERQNMLRDTEIAMEKERLQLRQDILAASMETRRLERIFRQQETLYNEQLTSREDYLKAREDYELSAEKMKLLRERIHRDSLYRSVQVAMMRESLDNMRRNFELVRRRTDYLNVRASHSGQLGSLDAQLGQSIAAGQKVGQLNIMDGYKVSVKIDEFYIDRITQGLSATLERNRADFAMTVAKVYPEVENGRFRADMSFRDSIPANIRVGQSYGINLRLGEPAEAVMVPRGAFFQSTGGRWVYVVSPDGRSATRRAIVIGRQNPQYYEITSGLEPGEKIILNGYAAFGEADRIILKHHIQ